MSYFIYNGKVCKEGELIYGPANRGVRYGDGLFETIKVLKGNIIFTDEHFSRLWKGLKLLGYNIPKLFTPELLEKHVQILLSKNAHTDARVRISVNRGNGGLYETGNIEYTIESWPLTIGPLNSNGLVTGIFTDAKKTADAFANCKHANFLPYVMGALYAKANQLNDVLILNDRGNVCDSTIANVFIIKGDEILTPALTEGCISGVMRKFLLQNLPALGWKIRETELTPQDCMDADEIFLTNSIFNLRWVSGLGDKNFGCEKVQEIYQILKENFSAYF